MAVVRTTALHFADGERSSLVEQIAASVDPRSDGSPVEVEPEPVETVKKRFGRDREVLTGFSASYSFVGGGARAAAAAIQGHLLWTTPDGLDHTTFTGALERASIRLPDSWSLDFETMPGTAYATTPDARGTDAAAMADWLLDGLLALGAPLPTGRWRTWWSDLYHPG
jgi:hypothetical protein